MQSENDTKLQTFLLNNKISLYIVKGKNIPSLRIRHGSGIWLPVHPNWKSKSEESLPFRVFSFFKGEYNLLSEGYKRFLLLTLSENSPAVQHHFRRRRRDLDSLIRLLDTRLFDIFSILSEGKTLRLHSLISKKIVVRHEKEYYPLNCHTIDSFEGKYAHLKKKYPHLLYFIQNLDSKDDSFFTLHPQTLFVNLENPKLILKSMIKEKELK